MDLVLAGVWQALGRPGAHLGRLCSGARERVMVLTRPCLLIPSVDVLTTAPMWRRSRPFWGACNQRPGAAAGTPEEAGARRWLLARGGSVKCLYGLVVGEERAGGRPGRDLDAGRLLALLAGLPALTSISWMILRGDLHRRPTRAAIRAFLAEAARAIAGCSSLQTLRLRISLLGGLAGQLPKALVCELASMRSLEAVTLSFEACEADRPDWPATFSLAHLVAGLARLPRLRELSLMAENVGMEATLPASVSRLAQLTSLSLRWFDGLRCEPGWAHLPALVSLKFEDCVFAGDGEAALPGMDALGALTSLELERCLGPRLLPASLWRLPQLRRLSHESGSHMDLVGVPRGELPAAGPPVGGAPCFASLTHLTLAGHHFEVFPPGVLAAVRLAHLDLSLCCFEQLPEGVSALSALTELRLGRHAAGEWEVGGRLDARALGSLARFPELRSLSFLNCSVLFDQSFQAAAAHPRLAQLQLGTSYPALGPSCMAFLGFVYDLLQRGRAGLLTVCWCNVEGAGRRDSRRFRAALDAVGFSLYEDALSDANE